MITMPEYAHIYCIMQNVTAFSDAFIVPKGFTAIMRKGATMVKIFGVLLALLGICKKRIKLIKKNIFFC